MGRRLLLACVLLSAPWRSACAYEPQINYMLQCMGCHTPDGSGEPGRVPSVRTTLVPFSRIPAGRRFLVQVPGVAQSTLSDAELASLLNWMIGHLSSDPGRDHFTPFSAAEVSHYRATPLTDVRTARAKLVAVTR
jgi:hypothetical protein